MPSYKKLSRPTRRPTSKGLQAMNGDKKDWFKGVREWRIPGYWNTSSRVKFLLYAVLALGMYGLVMGSVLPEQFDIEAGSISPETIVAPVDRVDQVATEQAREEAAAAVPEQYKTDDQVTEEQVEKINRLFLDARRNAEETSFSEKERIQNLNDRLPFDLSEEGMRKLVRIAADELVQTQSITRNIVQDVMNSGVKEEKTAEARDRVDRQLVTADLGSDARFVAREVARLAIVPNVVSDEAKTEAMREAAAESVEPVRINRGETIVYKGERVTEQQYRQLKELGLLNESGLWWSYIGLIIFIMLLLAFLYFSIEQLQVGLHADNTRLLMLVLIFVLNLGAMKIVSSGQSLEMSDIGYAAPVALGSMLIAILIDVRLALYAGVIFSAVAAVLFNPDGVELFNYRYGFVALMTCSASAFALTGVRYRSSILRAGFIVASVSVVPITAVYMLTAGSYRWQEFLTSIGFGVGGGLLAAVLTIGLLPFFEAAFSILSPMKLIELANPNQPLLRKLLVETPGTYHHSVIVGNLAESAAEAIGANGLLARVGSFYHDLGKTKRPQFFIENQVHGDNPHDKLSPHLSKTIIINHTRDGVEMLEKANIPKPIRDIAGQHHGTTLLKYFYHKALKMEDGGQVLEEDFRYPGPKAQFKEAAIVGIADAVEAAVRSIGKPTPSRIEAIVQKIIQDRLEDGQFDECDLTLKELDIIAKSMLETLQGIFHQRIKYPEDISTRGATHA